MVVSANGVNGINVQKDAMVVNNHDTVNVTNLLLKMAVLTVLAIKLKPKNVIQMHAQVCETGVFICFFNLASKDTFVSYFFHWN